MNISIKQAIDVIIELKEAADGVNGYGGDTAEIYAYTLLPHTPSGNHTASDYADAAESLGHLISKIAQRENKTALINDLPWKQWIEKYGDSFDHRVHVEFLD